MQGKTGCSNGRKRIQQKLFSNAKQASESSADDKREIENSKAQMLIGLLQTKIIVASAILEGAVFFLLIAYMAEHSMLSVSAAVVLLLLLVAQMPTSGPGDILGRRPIEIGRCVKKNGIDPRAGLH